MASVVSLEFFLKKFGEIHEKLFLRPLFNLFLQKCMPLQTNLVNFKNSVYAAGQLLVNRKRLPKRKGLFLNQYRCFDVKCSLNGKNEHFAGLFRPL